MKYKGPAQRTVSRRMGPEKDKVAKCQVSVVKRKGRRFTVLLFSYCCVTNATRRRNVKWLKAKCQSELRTISLKY